MNEATLSILLLWVFMLVYVVAGALDFGSGFWSMIYSNHKNTSAGEIANKYLSPAWEVTNVFLVMFVVALVSFFPKATFTFGTILLVPGSLILIILSIRTAFLVFAHSVEEYRKLLNQISGIAGILVPALLVVVLPVTHGGYVQVVNGVMELPLSKVFSSPSVYAFIGLALSSTLYLSALFLADYSHFANDHSAVNVYRRHAVYLGPISLVMGILVIVAIRAEAGWLYANIQERFFALALSVIAFIVSYGALLSSGKGKDGAINIALTGTIVQYLIAGYVYGSSHLPYLIYPTTVEESFTNLSMYRALIYSYIINTLLLIPVLIYHWRLFVRSRQYVEKKNLY